MTMKESRRVILLSKEESQFIPVKVKQSVDEVLEVSRVQGLDLTDCLMTVSVKEETFDNLTQLKIDTRLVAEGVGQ